MLFYEVSYSMRTDLPRTVFKKRQEVISYVRAVSLPPYYNIGLKLQKKKRNNVNVKLRTKCQACFELK